jgi:Mrp family chromosome partitioning ATPase
VRLDRANAPVLGIVLNQLHTREVHKYHRNYGYYYGGDKKEEPTAAARESA